MDAFTLDSAWRWTRRHLLRTRLDALLTVGAGFAIAFVAVPLAGWVVSGADWGVIAANRHLLLVGSYPAEQVWRVWAVVWMLMAMSGISLGALTESARLGWKIVGAGAAALLLLAVLSGAWEAALAGALLAAAYPLARRPGSAGRLLIPGWGVFAVATLVLLGGFEGSGWLPAVGTQRWGGFLLTALLTAVGIVVSLPLGVALALGRRGRLPVIRWFCVGYIELIRGVPLITVLFMGQLVIPLFLPPGWAIDNLIRVMAAVIIFSSAYMAENVRGGLQSLPHGQLEAAQALGLGVTATTFLIVLPQALRNVIPAIVGQCIALFKDTSLVAIIGLIDFLSAGQASMAQAGFAGREAEVYAFVAAVYWLFSFTLSQASRRLEQRLGVGER